MCFQLLLNGYLSGDWIFILSYGIHVGGITYNNNAHANFRVLEGFMQGSILRFLGQPFRGVYTFSCK